MRDAFGDALVTMAGGIPEMVVLDGDNATSTRTDRFAAAHPDRFFNVGIAEQNLIGVSAGLGVAGFRPVACAFASMLVNRGLDQIVNAVAVQRLGVVLAGHYAGLSAGREGACHHSIADVAVLRAVPNLSVLVPAADDDVAPLLRSAVTGDGPTYLRLSRNPARAVPAPTTGGLEYGWRYWGPERPSIVVVASGVLVAEALDAVDVLGVDVGVFNVVTMKPLPVEAVRAHVAAAQLVVTAEEHSVVGGLGSAVAAALGDRPGPIIRHVAIQDIFTESADHGELLRHYELTSTGIMSVIQSFLRGGSFVSNR